MVHIGAKTIKEIFSRAEKGGIFYPGLYEMVILIFYCGFPRQELVGLTIGDIFRNGMEERVSKCPDIIGCLSELRKNYGSLRKDTPLFPRYFPNKEKKFYDDFKKVCICVVGRPIRLAEIKHAGMRAFFLKLDSIKEKALNEKRKEINEKRKEIMPVVEHRELNNFFESRLESLDQTLREYKSSPFLKYKDVASQYGYNDARHVAKIMRGWKKQYYTNQDRLYMALNDLESLCNQFDVNQLEKQVWKILYYVYHRDRKKGDKPQEWYVKRYIVDLFRKIENWSKTGKIKITSVMIKKTFEQIAKNYPEKLSQLTRNDVEF